MTLCLAGGRWAGARGSADLLKTARRASLGLRGGTDRLYLTLVTSFRHSTVGGTLAVIVTRLTCSLFESLAALLRVL